MSLPMSIISFYLHSSIFKYFHFSSLFTLNLQSFLFKNKSISTITQREVKYNAFILSSFINCLALFFVVLFFAHPQINNRIFSACPVFYFFCTDEILKLATRRRFYFRGFLILVFFIVFSILSCLLQVGSYGFA